MNARPLILAAASALAACAATTAPAVDRPAATASAIALSNLDHLIAQAGDEPEVVDLLVLRVSLLVDDRALDRIAALTETAARTPDELLRRARARATAHRFEEASADLDAAARAGASPGRVRSQRASLHVATGHAVDELGWLRSQAAASPTFATHCSLALAEAAAGHVEQADALYATALRELDTTSPFPAAAVWFARGMMWSEQAGDTRRGARMYEQALRLVPEYVVANVHLAEIEAARGDVAAAVARLERSAAASEDAESLALLGTLHARMGQAARGREEIEHARRRYESLLERHPLAFADHAAEFYLGVGADPERGLYWARINLLARETRRATALAWRAARAAGRDDEARDLAARLATRFDPRAA
jgi:tetratricopeptide (TPR) repeat protein